MKATLAVLFRYHSTMRSHFHPNHRHQLLLHDRNEFTTLDLVCNNRLDCTKLCPVLPEAVSSNLNVQWEPVGFYTTDIPFPLCQLFKKKKNQQLMTPMLWHNIKHSKSSEVKIAWPSQDLTWCDFCQTSQSMLQLGQLLPLSDLITTPYTAFPELRCILNCFNIRSST